jgi:cytidylate kinase
MIITIDGPAGSGKSTAARKLAARLEVAYLDTGAMYRAIAHAASQGGADFSNEDELLAVARSIRLELDCGPTHTRVRVDGHDVSEAIRTMAVSALTSPVARHQGIRNLLVEQQRAIGRTLGSFVSEGRDQGTEVFPAADVKFVLEASLEKRGERRRLELAVDGEDLTLAEVMDNLQARDRLDSKQWAPLLTSGNAILVDTTERTIKEVIDLLTGVVERVRSRAGADNKGAA